MLRGSVRYRALCPHGRDAWWYSTLLLNQAVYGADRTVVAVDCPCPPVGGGS